jgi:hypothetical protein
MRPGKATRHHDAYDKNGACCVLLAFAPHTGVRYVDVRQQRPAVDEAPCMKNLLEQHSPPIAQIRLGQDNLHTQTPGAFYAGLPPDEAFAWSQQFVPHYPPKKGSWVNRAEIACAARSTQGLHRRIAEGDPCRQAVLAWATTRNHERTTGHWRCSQTEARTTLQRHYQNVQKFI